MRQNEYLWSKGLNIIQSINKECFQNCLLHWFSTGKKTVTMKNNTNLVTILSLSGGNPKDNCFCLTNKSVAAYQQKKKSKKEWNR